MSDYEYQLVSGDESSDDGMGIVTVSEAEACDESTSTSTEEECPGDHSNLVPGDESDGGQREGGELEEMMRSTEALLAAVRSDSGSGVLEVDDAALEAVLLQMQEDATEHALLPEAVRMDATDALEHLPLSETAAMDSRSLAFQPTGAALQPAADPAAVPDTVPDDDGDDLLGTSVYEDVRTDPQDFDSGDGYEFGAVPGAILRPASEVGAEVPPEAVPLAASAAAPWGPVASEAIAAAPEGGQALPGSELVGSTSGVVAPPSDLAAPWYDAEAALGLAPEAYIEGPVLDAALGFVPEVYVEALEGPAMDIEAPADVLYQSTLDELEVASQTGSVSLVSPDGGCGPLGGFTRSLGSRPGYQLDESECEDEDVMEMLCAAYAHHDMAVADGRVAHAELGADPPKASPGASEPDAAGGQAGPGPADSSPGRDEHAGRADDDSDCSSEASECSTEPGLSTLAASHSLEPLFTGGVSLQPHLEAPSLEASVCFTEPMAASFLSEVPYGQAVGEGWHAAGFERLVGDESQAGDFMPLPSDPSQLDDLAPLLGDASQTSSMAPTVEMLHDGQPSTPGAVAVPFWGAIDPYFGLDLPETPPKTTAPLGHGWGDMYCAAADVAGMPELAPTLPAPSHTHLVPDVGWQLEDDGAPAAVIRTEQSADSVHSMGGNLDVTERVHSADSIRLMDSIHAEAAAVGRRRAWQAAAWVEPSEAVPPVLPPPAPAGAPQPLSLGAPSNNLICEDMFFDGMYYTSPAPALVGGPAPPGPEGPPAPAVPQLPSSGAPPSNSLICGDMLFDGVCYTSPAPGQVGHTFPTGLEGPAAAPELRDMDWQPPPTWIGRWLGFAAQQIATAVAGVGSWDEEGGMPQPGTHEQGHAAASAMETAAQGATAPASPMTRSPEDALRSPTAPGSSAEQPSTSQPPSQLAVATGGTSADAAAMTAPEEGGAAAEVVAAGELEASRADHEPPLQQWHEPPLEQLHGLLLQDLSELRRQESHKADSMLHEEVRPDPLVQASHPSVPEPSQKNPELPSATGTALAAIITSHFEGGVGPLHHEVPSTALPVTSTGHSGASGRGSTVDRHRLFEPKTLRSFRGLNVSGLGDGSVTPDADKVTPFTRGLIPEADVCALDADCATIPSLHGAQAPGSGSSESLASAGFQAQPPACPHPPADQVMLKDLGVAADHPFIVRGDQLLTTNDEYISTHVTADRVFGSSPPRHPGQPLRVAGAAGTLPEPMPPPVDFDRLLGVEPAVVVQGGADGRGLPQVDYFAGVEHPFDLPPMVSGQPAVEVPTSPPPLLEETGSAADAELDWLDQMCTPLPGPFPWQLFDAAPQPRGSAPSTPPRPRSPVDLLGVDPLDVGVNYPSMDGLQEVEEDDEDSGGDAATTGPLDVAELQVAHDYLAEQLLLTSEAFTELKAQYESLFASYSSRCTLLAQLQAEVCARSTRPDADPPADVAEPWQVQTGYLAGRPPGEGSATEREISPGQTDLAHDDGQQSSGGPPAAALHGGSAKKAKGVKARSGVEAKKEKRRRRGLEQPTQGPADAEGRSEEGAAAGYRSGKTHNCLSSVCGMMDAIWKAVPRKRRFIHKLEFTLVCLVLVLCVCLIAVLVALFPMLLSLQPRGTPPAPLGNPIPVGLDSAQRLHDGPWPPGAFNDFDASATCPPGAQFCDASPAGGFRAPLQEPQQPGPAAAPHAEEARGEGVTAASGDAGGQAGRTQQPTPRPGTTEREQDTKADRMASYEKLIAAAEKFLGSTGAPGVQVHLRTMGNATLPIKLKLEAAAEKLGLCGWEQQLALAPEARAALGVLSSVRSKAVGAVRLLWAVDDALQDSLMKDRAVVAHLSANWAEAERLRYSYDELSLHASRLASRLTSLDAELDALTGLEEQAVAQLGELRASVMQALQALVKEEAETQAAVKEAAACRERNGKAPRGWAREKTKVKHHRNTGGCAEARASQAAKELRLSSASSCLAAVHAADSEMAAAVASLRRQLWRSQQAAQRVQAARAAMSAPATEPVTSKSLEKRAYVVRTRLQGLKDMILQQ